MNSICTSVYSTLAVSGGNAFLVLGEMESMAIYLHFIALMFINNL